MNRSIKALLTFSYLIGLIYVATLFSTDFFLWITNNFIPYEQQNLLTAVITYPAVTYLLYRLWSFKNVDNSTKGSWTFLLLFLGIITIPIYIWKTDDDLMEKNPKTTLHDTI